MINDTDSGISEPTRVEAQATQLFFFFNIFFNTHTYSAISIHAQCLYTAFEHSFHQCNITEIKPQTKISPQFGLFNSEKPLASGRLRPQTSCFTTLNFLALPSLNTWLHHWTQINTTLSQDTMGSRTQPHKIINARCYSFYLIDLI